MTLRNSKEIGELIQLAKQYYQNNDFENAKNKCVLALAGKLGKRHKIELLYLLGDIEFMRNDLPRAKDAYNEAMVNLMQISQTSKICAQILVGLSNAKRGLGEFHEAETDARMAIEMIPQQDLITFRRAIEALCNLVKIYAATGLKAQASNILSLCSRMVEMREDPESLSLVKTALKLMSVDESEQ